MVATAAIEARALQLLTEQDELNARLFAQGTSLAPRRLVPSHDNLEQIARLADHVHALRERLSRGAVDDEPTTSSARIALREHDSQAGPTTEVRVSGSMRQRGVDAPHGATLGLLACGVATSFVTAMSGTAVLAAAAPLAAAAGVAMWLRTRLAIHMTLDARRFQLPHASVPFHEVGFFELVYPLGTFEVDPLVMLHPPSRWPVSVLAGHGRPTMVLETPAAEALVVALNRAVRSLRARATPYRD